MKTSKATKEVLPLQQTIALCKVSGSKESIVLLNKAKTKYGNLSLFGKSSFQNPTLRPLGIKGPEDKIVQEGIQNFFLLPMKLATVNHHKLISIFSTRIQDQRFFDRILKMLKAGYTQLRWVLLLQESEEIEFPESSP